MSGETGVFFGPCPQCGHEIAQPGIVTMWRCRACNAERYDLGYLSGDPPYGSCRAAIAPQFNRPSNIIAFPAPLPRTPALLSQCRSAELITLGERQ